jgi:hypothetical protein
MLGILIGEAKDGTTRASVFAGPNYWPQRLSDLFCRHKLSHQAFMAKLVEVAWAYLYPTGLPARLFWIADSTYTEKPYAKRVASVGLFHRTKRVAGQAKHLQGHCYVFAAHLYKQTMAMLPRWASVLVGTLVYVKGPLDPGPGGCFGPAAAAAEHRTACLAGRPGHSEPSAAARAGGIGPSGGWQSAL